MTEAQLERLAQLALAFIRTHPDTPYDLGNLKYNSLMCEKTGEYEYSIFIDLEIAPYQRYLNDYENIPIRVKKAGSEDGVEEYETRYYRNKHYQWWEKMKVEVAQYLQRFISDSDGMKSEMDRMQKIIDAQMSEYGEKIAKIEARKAARAAKNGGKTK